MAFDFKKEYKEFYLPDKKPGIVMVPKMNYLAVRGQGDPNKEDGEYNIRSTGILIMLFPRSKASGGRKALRESTTPIKRTSGGFP